MAVTRLKEAAVSPKSCHRDESAFPFLSPPLGQEATHPAGTTSPHRPPLKIREGEAADRERRLRRSPAPSRRACALRPRLRPACRLLHPPPASSFPHLLEPPSAMPFPAPFAGPPEPKPPPGTTPLSAILGPPSKPAAETEPETTAAISFSSELTAANCACVGDAQPSLF